MRLGYAGVILGLLPLLFWSCAKEEAGTVPLAEDSLGEDSLDLDTAPPAPDTLDIFQENEPVWARLQVPVEEAWRALKGGEDGNWLLLAGDRGAVLGLEDGQWAYMNLGTQEHLRAIKAEGPEDFVVVGTEGAIWRRKSSGPGQPSIWVDLSAAWFRKELLAVDGASLDDLWIGGEEGSLLHVLGPLLLKIDPGVLGLAGETLPSIHGVLMVEGQPMVLAGDQILYLDGEVWKQEYKTPDGEQLKTIVAGAGATWVGGAGGSVFVRRDGQWSKGDGPTYYSFDALWVDSLGTAFATGQHKGSTALIWFGDETALATMTVESPEYVPEGLRISLPIQITGLWGSHAEDLYACTSNGQLLHYAIH